MARVGAKQQPGDSKNNINKRAKARQRATGLDSLESDHTRIGINDSGGNNSTDSQMGQAVGSTSMGLVWSYYGSSAQIPEEIDPST